MSGSHIQFEAIVREHQAMVFRTLLRLTGDREQVEDLAQEVFLRLYRGLENFRGQAKVSTYLYRIVVNVAQDAWKRRRKERAAILTPFRDDDESTSDPMELFAHPGADAEHQLIDRELWEAIDTMLLDLPEAERAVLVLYHQEECSYEAIAEVLQLPIGTVRTHLHRGRKRLGELTCNRLKIKEVATK
jgi:RNA polymerase sigma-70 factor, ECF subfamily